MARPGQASILSSDLTGERHRSTVALLLIFTNLCALNLRVSNLSATFQSKPRHPTSHITISHPSVENIHLNIHPWLCHGDAGMDGPSVELVIASVMTFLPLIDCHGACISTLTPHCHNQSTVSGDDQSIMMFRCSLVFIWDFLVDGDGYTDTVTERWGDVC